MQGKYDFKFLDLTDPSVFGFDPKQFYDGMHMTTVNTRKAIDYILKQTGGVPPVEAAGGRAVGPAACSSTATRSC